MKFTSIKELAQYPLFLNEFIVFQEYANRSGVMNYQMSHQLITGGLQEMTEKFIVSRDTATWQFQVWTSFGLAVFVSGIGIWNMPSESLDRAFIAIGFFFCLFASFTLAKMIRDNRDKRVDTGAWIFTVWAGFAVAILLTAWGLYRMKIGNWEKGYMTVSWLFLISSVFTLSKTVRDKHEANLMMTAKEFELSPPMPLSEEKQ